ncbi:hypothetical protein ACFYQB_03060, partial [Streptomyces hirsutus]
MSTVTRVSRRLGVIVVFGLVVPLLALPRAAHADDALGEESQGSEQHAETGGDGTVSVTVGGVVFDRSKNGRGGSAGVLRSSTSWAPPPCW